VRTIVATVMLAGLMCCTGCMSVAKRGLAEVQGARCEIYPIKSVPSGTAQSASAITVAPVESDGTGGAEFRTALQAGLTKAVAKEKPTGGSGAPLTLKAVVRFYEGKGASKLTGGMAFAITRIELIDEQKNVIAKADTLASTKAMRTGEDDLAAAMGKEILEWILKGKK